MKVYVDANPKMVGWVTEDGQSKAVPIIERTNNEAEYSAVLMALRAVKDVTEILSDSQLIVNQLNRKWHIKEARLREYALEIWKHPGVAFTWIPRKENLAGKLLG